jgi:hypothetical protein
MLMVRNANRGRGAHMLDGVLAIGGLVRMVRRETPV